MQINTFLDLWDKFLSEIEIEIGLGLFEVGFQYRSRISRMVDII